MPLPFTWPYALFWLIFFWSFTPEFGIIRRAQRTAGATDSKSVNVIVYVSSFGMFSAFPLAFVHMLQFPAAWRVALYFVGIVVFLGGSFLRRHCFRMLGASFTGDVRARPDQVVVTRGAYSILRHPSYTAGILLYIGLGMVLGSWASTIVLGVASFAAYSYRMKVEERALSAVIGEPYQEFMRTRKRIIPYVY